MAAFAVVLFGEDEESLRRRVGIAGFNGDFLCAVHALKVRSADRSGAEMPTSDALGNAAKEFVGNGARGVCQSLDGRVVSEDLHVGASVDIEACHVHHATVHADLSHDGPEGACDAEVCGAHTR